MLLPYKSRSVTCKTNDYIYMPLQYTGICTAVKIDNFQMSLVVRKPVFGVSDQAIHKPGCTVTEDS